MAARPRTAVATTKAKIPLSAELMAKIQQDIQDQAEMVQPSNSNRIKLNSASGKKYVFPDKREVSEFDGIVVDFATVQVLYNGPFVAGQVNSIVCYASATKPSDLAPHSEVLTPQATDCKSCAKSKFGPDGSKPECNLRKLLAILPVDADASTELMVLDLPVMAAKAFDKYAQNTLVTKNLPIYGVITRFSFDDTVKFDSPRFEAVDVCDGAQGALAYNRRDEARRMLLAAPTINPIEEPVKAASQTPRRR